VLYRDLKVITYIGAGTPGTGKKFIHSRDSKSSAANPWALLSITGLLRAASMET